MLSNESKWSEPETHFDLIDTDADSGILIQELAVFFTGEARATAARGFPLSISSAKKKRSVRTPFFETDKLGIPTY